MGSPANGVHLEQLCDVLSLVASKRKFILRYMCRTPLNLIIPNAIIEHLSFENYYENIRSFDIGLCPFLTVDIRSKGKIAMKNQEYMMCAIPQVCSHVAISEHLVNGESALIAENIDQWEKHILEIIDNIDLREKLGTNSYKIFNQYYLYDIEYANLKKSLIN
jgi:glycosyltransferase involved in cell wall biosynthesis